MDFRIGGYRIISGQFPGTKIGPSGWEAKMQRDIIGHFRDEGGGNFKVAGQNFNWTGTDAVTGTKSGYGRILTESERQAIDGIIKDVVTASADKVTGQPRLSREEAMIMMADLIAARATSEAEGGVGLEQLRDMDLAEVAGQLRTAGYFGVKNDDDRIRLMLATLHIPTA